MEAQDLLRKFRLLRLGPEDCEDQEQQEQGQNPPPGAFFR